MGYPLLQYIFFLAFTNIQGDQRVSPIQAWQRQEYFQGQSLETKVLNSDESHKNRGHPSNFKMCSINYIFELYDVKTSKTKTNTDNLGPIYLYRRNYIVLGPYAIKSIDQQGVHDYRFYSDHCVLIIFFKSLLLYENLSTTISHIIL